VEHDGIATSHAYLTDFGRVLRTAIITGSSTIPDGLLVLAELDPGSWGDSLLREVTKGVEGPEEGWGLSLGADISWTDDKSEIVAVLPREVSLTRSPGIEGARVLAVGPRALRAWELLVSPVFAPLD